MICWAALAVLTGLSIALRIWLNRRVLAPSILTDELTYSQLAENIANGAIDLRSGYGIIYPALLAPAWAFADYGTTAYTYMQTTNAIVISLVAIPVFLWARRVMRPWFALLAVAMTLAMPSLAYSGLIMTENAFLPVFVVACLAIAYMVERPTVWSQIMMFVTLAVAYETRAQATILLIALPAVILLSVVSGARADRALSAREISRRLAVFWPLGVGVVIAVVFAAIRAGTSSWRPADLLQAYSSTTTAQYDAGVITRWVVYHAGEATFAVGVLPVAALLVLSGLWLRNRLETPAARAFVATAVIVIPLVLIQVAAFTSAFSQRVSERNMMCIFPLLMIALALWLDRGLPRPRRITAIAVAITAALVALLPFGFLYQTSPSTETWAVLLPAETIVRLPRGAEDVQTVIMITLAMILLIFGIVRTRIAIVLVPLLVLGYFAFSESSVVRALERTSTAYRAAPSVGLDADWLDRSIPVGEQVGFVTGSTLGSNDDQLILWQTGFFNRTPLTVIPWGANMSVNSATGALAAADGSPLVLPRYVILPASYQLVGRTLNDRGVFILQEPAKPYRLAHSSQGIYADGWTGPSATIDVYDVSTPAPLTLKVNLNRFYVYTPDSAAKVTVRVGRLVTLTDGSVGIASVETSRTWEAHNGTETNFELPIPAPPIRIEIIVDPPFSPADFGLGDARQLGVRVGISHNGSVISR